MQKIIPNKPRYKFVQKTARDILVELNITTFPVDPFKIIQAYSDRILCFSWTEGKIILGSNDPFHLKRKGIDARIIWVPHINKSILVYDDTQLNPFRERWTIMHELGHFFLGHLTDFPDTEIKKTDNEHYAQEYGVLEVEAHAFAAEVLCPSAIFPFFQRNGKIIITKDYLAHLFLLSNEASAKRLDGITSGRVPIAKDPILARNFFNFFQYGQAKALYENLSLFNLDYFSYPHYDKFARKCPSCHSYMAHADYDYCPYCGFKLGSNYDNLDYIFDSPKIIEEDIRVYKLPSAPPPIGLCWNKGLDGYHHLLFCPHCFSANTSKESYCTHCGNPLVNVCHAENRKIPLGARFCPYCGKPSSFNHIYAEVEAAYKKMTSYCQDIAQSMELEPYPYWNFMKTQNDEIPVRTALAYSKAYLNDDDELIVFVRDQASKDMLEEYLTPLSISYKKHDPSLTNILFQVVH